MGNQVEIAGQLLVDANLGHWSEDTPADDATSWPVWLSVLPFAKGQDNTGVGLFGPQGLLQGRIMRTGESIVFPGLQVRVQNVNYYKAHDKIGEIYNYFTRTVRRTEVTVRGKQYRVDNVSPSTTIIELGLDKETDLQNFSANFFVRVTALA